MKPIRQIAAVSLLIFAIGFIAWRAALNPERTVRRQALTRREVATRVLAEYLAKEFAGRRALVLSNPFTQLPGQTASVLAFEASGIRGLKKGWGEHINLVGVVFPQLKPAAIQDPSSVPIDPQCTTPLSFLTVETAWDDLARSNPSADLFVSLIGLPLNLSNLEVWRQPKPAFALLLPDLRMIGNGSAIRDALHGGKLAAIVLNRPGAPPESLPMAADAITEFDQRFLLVTPKNVDEIQRAYPQVF